MKEADEICLARLWYSTLIMSINPVPLYFYEVMFLDEGFVSIGLISNVPLNESRHDVLL
jgi:hypothetical protein